MWGRGFIVDSTIDQRPKLLVQQQFFITSMMIAKIITMSLAACILIPAVLSDNNPIEIASSFEDKDQMNSQDINNDDIRYIKNIIDAYKNYRRLDTNFEDKHDQDSKYPVLKRNADIINTLLGIPRRMLIVGR